MSLSLASTLLEGDLHGGDVEFCGVSTDTRSLHPGELFFALRGPRYDGHDMLSAAEARGAVAAVVDRKSTHALRQIVVSETRRALGALARAWRLRFALPVIGITGSAGKTSVKEMLGQVMRGRGPALVTAGNLNNEIGVPATLFGLAEEHSAAVIEMGASRAGDIAYLADIARPTIGVVTLCAPAHLEGFGDIETVARTKGELFSGLGSDGIAVINNEDRFAPLWRRLAAPRRVITFGEGGDVGASAIIADDTQTRFVLSCAAGEVDVDLPVRGRHNVSNALAAAAAAIAAGLDINAIAIGLASTKPVKGRLMPRPGIGGSRLIDDSYNANPASLDAALGLLRSVRGSKWLVLGDMGELGTQAGALHETAGRAAREAGVERLFTIGALAERAQLAFGSGARHFDDLSALIDCLRAALASREEPTTVLIKASRFMALDRVAEALAVQEPSPC